MREQDGKFMLLDINDFRVWLESTSFSRVIKLLQAHHTFQPDYAVFRRQKDHFVLLRNMERSHVLERGFSAIAQNLTTFPDGLVAVCRPIDSIPAGIKGANQYGICVENLGNFDANQDAMTPEHRDCILKVFAHLCRRFNLIPNSDTIQYHHWWDLNTGKRTNGTGTTKTCPGSQFFSGNSVSSAENNFIPLVNQAVAAIGAALPAVEPKYAYSGEVAVDLLNVRTMPSSSGAVLKQLSRGVAVRVYEDRNGWSRIDPNRSCWVSSHFLQVASSKATAIYCAQVTADLLNVRSLPALSGNIMNRLQHGAIVYIYEERDNWSRIDQDASLWVSSSYLARTSAATV
jgi:SH3-like domain-containing protein